MRILRTARPQAASPARRLLLPWLALALPALLLGPLTGEARPQTAAAAPATGDTATPDADAAHAAPPRFAPGELQRRLDHLQARVDAAREDLHIPGCALGVVIDGQPVLLQGFGVADVETQRAVRPETLFAIGSSTKAFTATLCAMLVDEGKLHWDDPIAEHVPEFVLHVDPGPGHAHGEAPVVTLRDVLSHRTGFSRNDILWAGHSVPRDTILRTAAQAEPWAPYRTEFLYNNVQVMSAGVAAGRIAGIGWDALLKRRLLEPLHMVSTTSSVTACADDPRLAKGYVWEDHRHGWRHLPMRNLDAIGPAGSINSNVLDMTQWLRLLLAGGVFDGQRLVSDAALEETWSPQIATGKDTAYGLCWFLSEWKGHRVVEHGGNIDGFAAEVALLPDDGVGFVLLNNVTATPLQHTSQELVFDALLGAVPADEAATAAGGATTAQASADAAAAQFDACVGAYTCNSPVFRDVDMKVLVKDGRLAIDVPGQTVYKLRDPDADGRWVFELTDTIAISFQRDAAGQVVSLTMYQGGLALEMPKVGVARAPLEPLAPLARLLGHYADAEMDITVKLHNQRLALDVPGQMLYELGAPDEAGLRPFRPLSGYAAQFEELDGRVTALVLHQPNGTFRFERKAAPEGEAAAGAEKPLPALEAVLALRGTAAEAASWNALLGVRLSGTIRFANAGLTGRITTTLQGTDRFREELDFGDFGFANEATDGTHAWACSTFEAWRELEGKELQQGLQTPANILGDWRARFSGLRVLRRETQDGRDAVVVELTDGDLPPTLVYVAEDDGQLLRVDNQQLLSGEGLLPETVTFGDWQPAGAAKIPLRSFTRSEATGRVEVHYDKVETGLTLAPETFRLQRP